jgi:beta-N-acetylhexosaminidase
MLRLLAVALLLAGCATFTPLDPATLARIEPHLGQLLLVGFAGVDGTDTPEPAALVCDVRAGGLLLFARNVVDAAQVRRLTEWIRERAAACDAGAPLIAMDAEGGRVMRLAPRAGYVDTPSARELAEHNDLALTELEARRIGRMLREAGVTWDLAPVVDVGYNPTNPVIVGSGRSYGANPLIVTAHARAFIRGLHAEGILTALKHFPGHGSSRRDSHHGFTEVTDTAVLCVELQPYRALIAAGLADSVMTAHVFNRGLDPWDPATLSRFTVRRVLRGWLDYDGVVVSDDLLMGAIAQHYGLEEAAVLALGAGVDVLLISRNTGRIDDRAAERVVAAVTRAIAEGRLSESAVQAAVARVDALRARLR